MSQRAMRDRRFTDPPIPGSLPTTGITYRKDLPPAATRTPARSAETTPRTSQAATTLVPDTTTPEWPPTALPEAPTSLSCAGNPTVEANIRAHLAILDSYPTHRGVGGRSDFGYVTERILEELIRRESHSVTYDEMETIFKDPIYVHSCVLLEALPIAWRMAAEVTGAY